MDHIDPPKAPDFLKHVRISKWKPKTRSLERIKLSGAEAVRKKLEAINKNRIVHSPERLQDSTIWRVKWIHIPVNDMTICKYVLRQVCKPAQADKLCDDEFWGDQMHEPYNEDDDTPSQAPPPPTKSSHIRKKAPFMDPLLYLCEFDIQDSENWKVQDEGRGEQRLRQLKERVENAIVYMPYLHWAKLDVHMQETNDRCGPRAKYQSPLKHPRRSLDEAALRQHTFKALEKRNQSQVVTRYLEKEAWRKYGAKPEMRDLSLVVVDQLWLWVLDEETLVTSFPDSPDSESHNADEVDGKQKRCQLLHLECLSREWMTNKTKIWGKGAWSLSRIIIDRATNIFKHAHLRDPDLKYLDFFLASMEEERSKCTELFLALHPRGENALTIQARHSSHAATGLFGRRSRYPRSAFKIDQDIDAVASIRDIEDELRMMLHIVKLQKTVLMKITNGPWQKLKDSINLFESELEGLCDQAVNIHEKLSQTLELKQTLLSIRQNQIVLVFTIITIIFLPLGFISSLFGMNAAELSDGSPMHLSLIFTYMFPISLAFSLAVLFISLGSDMTAWIQSLWNDTRNSLVAKSSPPKDFDNESPESGTDKQEV